MEEKVSEKGVMNNSKEEIAKKGHMEGFYTTGQGKAHKCCNPHKKVFNCGMYGTFNIWLETGRIDHFAPSIVTDSKSYWFVKITKEEQSYYGWAVRDHSSHQAMKTLEVLTKQLLPDCLKKGRLAINILEKWGNEEIKKWAKQQYWFQTFPFTPMKRADSEFLWNTIDKINWSGCSVLDIGCHYGFFSFKASEGGARVIGVEPNTRSITIANIIRDNIIHQDVKFFREIPTTGNFDVVLYLSVHHQIDPEYKNLSERINELKTRANQHLFVELIMPPIFPKKEGLSEEQIDKIVGGEVIARYLHRVRGVRKVYWIKKNV